jgi:GNAT superfamily N-acetyltransferase
MPWPAFAWRMAGRLREATLRDLPVLVRHRDAMWTEMGRVRPGEPDPTSLAYAAWIAERMRRGTLSAFIAERRGEVLASGAVWVQEVQPRPGHPRTQWGYILSLYTEPTARRHGLARAILRACIAQARRAGCTRCCLHASDAGRPMYERIGFEPTSEMWLDLRPPEQRPKPAPVRKRRPAKSRR